MKFDASKLNVAIPAALIPFAVPFATIAAEGTGRVSVLAFNFIHNTSIHCAVVDDELIRPSLSQAFGIDDGRLIIAALLPSLIIFPLYNKWSSDQEGDDFFDGYEKRRNG